MFELYGVIQPGSLRYDPSRNSYQFRLTNFKKEVLVVFKGSSTFELKEGDNLIMTGYMPNESERYKVVATSFKTNHSMEAENWMNGVNMKREGNTITI